MGQWRSANRIHHASALLAALAAMLAASGAAFAESPQGPAGTPSPAGTPPPCGITALSHWLATKTVPYGPTTKIPGDPLVAQQVHPNGTYLETGLVSVEELPYPVEVAKTYAIPKKLPQTLADFPKANVTKVTKTIPVSQTRSGTNSYVRLAEVDGHRPVVLKALAESPAHGTGVPHFSVPEAKIVAEGQGSLVFSELGIGPRFHGVFKDAEGRWNLVTDFIPGDMWRAEWITPQTFDDLETGIHRLKEAGYYTLDDPQGYITPKTGRFLFIDAGELTKLKPLSDLSKESEAFISLRLRLVAHADPAIGIPYLENMRHTRPDIWQRLGAQLKHWSKVNPAYASYFRMHGLP